MFLSNQYVFQKYDAALKDMEYGFYRIFLLAHSDIEIICLVNQAQYFQCYNEFRLQFSCYIASYCVWTYSLEGTTIAVALVDYQIACHWPMNTANHTFLNHNYIL